MIPKRCYLVLFFLAVNLNLLTSNTFAQQELPHIQVDLFDGTRIIGIPLDELLGLDLGFVQIQVPFQLCRRLQRAQRSAAVRLELTNRDHFTGKLISTSLEVRTNFGKLKVNSADIKSIRVFRDDQGIETRQPDSNGLIVFFDFDSSAKQLVRNQATDRHHLNIEKSNLKATGKRGQTLTFNGSRYFKVAHNQELCPERITVSAWIKPADQNGQYAFILGKSAGSSWNGGYAFARMSGDSENIYFYVNGYKDAVAKVRVAKNEWVHLTAVCDGKTLNLYRNGDEVSTASVSAGMLKHVTAPLTIGGDEGGYLWQGSIDDIAIYNRALPEDEVKQLFDDLNPHFQ